MNRRALEIRTSTRLGLIDTPTDTPHTPYTTYTTPQTRVVAIVHAFTTMYLAVRLSFMCRPLEIGAENTPGQTTVVNVAGGFFLYDIISWAIYGYVINKCVSKQGLGWARGAVLGHACTHNRSIVPTPHILHPLPPTQNQVRLPPALPPRRLPPRDVGLLGHGPLRGGLHLRPLHRRAGEPLHVPPVPAAGGRVALHAPRADEPGMCGCWEMGAL